MPEFDPRAAALAEAYAAAVAASMNQGDGNPVVWEDEAVQGVVAGLVYIGDQLGRLASVADAEVVSARRLEAALKGDSDVGDQVDGSAPAVEEAPASVAEPLRVAMRVGEFLPYLEARLMEVLEGGRARFMVGPSVFEVRLGETFRLYVDLAGRPDVQIERGYKAALEKIAGYEEHFGSAPSEDEMRDIAMDALAAW